MALIARIAFLAMIVAIKADINVDEKKVKIKNDISNIQEGIKEMQGDTEDLRTSLKKFSTGLNEYIKDEDNQDKLEKRIATANAVVLGISKAIPKFKSGDATQIISGVLDMNTIALTTFGGPHGAAAAAVLTVVSSLFTAFQNDPESSPTMDQVMKDVLDEFHDAQLLTTMNSFLANFKYIHKAIIRAHRKSKDKEGRDLTANDVTLLKTEIKTFETNILLENVKQSIADEIVSGKVKDAIKVLKTLNVYSKLTTVVELVVFEFLALIQEESIEEGILPDLYYTFVEEKRIRDKDFLEFLHLPEKKEAIAAAIYQHKPAHYPILRDYISAIKVTPLPKSELTEGQTIYLSPKKWPTWYFFLTSKTHSLIRGSETISGQSEFNLRRALIGAPGYEFRIESKYYPDYFLTAEKYSACMPTKNPDEVEPVKGLTMEYIKELESQCHNIATTKYSQGCYTNCFSYWKIGAINGLMSVNYVWRFTKLKTKTGCSNYLISATQDQFGPGYSLFMKDTLNVDAYLKFGNPGDMGVFRVKKRCK